jgi:hypothetical protein
MMRTDCDTVREILSEGPRGASRQDLDLHLAVCAECRADVEVMDLLRRAAVSAPAGLQERVTRTVHARKVTARWPYRAALLVAASVVALLGARALLVQRGDNVEPLAAVGTPGGPQAVTSQAQTSSETQRPPSGTEARSLMQPFPGSGLAMAADAITLDDLSEEQLKSLIAEL